ncbi:hypothetical protein ACM66B_002760 [Microbotryomycetes sp. NB124-2]
MSSNDGPETRASKRLRLNETQPTREATEAVLGSDSSHDVVILDPWPPNATINDVITSESDEDVASADADVVSQTDAHVVPAASVSLEPPPPSHDSSSTTPKKAAHDHSTLSSQSGHEKARVKAHLHGRVWPREASKLLEIVGIEQKHWESTLKAARTRLHNDPSASSSVQDCERACKAEETRKGRVGDEQHWFRKLANLASEGSGASSSTVPPRQLSMAIHSNPTHKLRILPDDPVQLTRKPDAVLGIRQSLGASDDFAPTFGHVVMPLEFTNERVAAPTYSSDKLPSSKLMQLVTLLVAVQAAQPFRTFVPGLHIDQRNAVLMVLNREALSIATVQDCWTTNCAQLAALANTLLQLQPHQLGLFPAYTYSITRAHGIKMSQLRTDLLPVECRTTFEMDQYETIRLARPTTPRHSPFSRGTMVVAFDKPGLGQLVVKMQAVGLDRRRRESQVWSAIQAARSKLSSVVLPRVSEILCTIELHRWHRDASPPQPPEALSLTPRQYALVVSQNPSDTLPQRLTESDVSPCTLIKVIQQAFDVLFSLFEDAKVLHCDISSGNVLHDNGRLVLVDWDCAIVVGGSSQVYVGKQNERTGTIDTMAVNVLRSICDFQDGKEDQENDTHAADQFSHLLRHDFESVAYLLLKVVWVKLSPSEPTAIHRRTWSHLLFDKSDVTVDELWPKRQLLWANNTRTPADCIRPLSPAFADFVDDLLREPFDNFKQFEIGEDVDRNLTIKARIDQVFKSVRWSEIETEALVARWGKPKE